MHPRDTTRVLFKIARQLLQLRGRRCIRPVSRKSPPCTLPSRLASGAAGEVKHEVPILAPRALSLTCQQVALMHMLNLSHGAVTPLAASSYRSTLAAWRGRLAGFHALVA
jgi:hypothetical protein